MADEEDKQPQGALAFRLLFPLPFVVLGGLIVLQSLGFGQFVGRSLVPNWVLALAGLVFLLAGLAFYCKFFLGDAGASVSGWLGNLIVLALAGVFVHVLGVVPFIASLFNIPLGGYQPWVVTQGALEIREHSQRRAQPLQAFAGRWESRMNMFGAGWVTRLEVRVAGGEAQANLWRACPPNHCDAGWFPAKIESAPAGQAYALHFSGQANGMDWVVSLRAPLGQAEGLMLDERHIRGKDWNTHQQQVPPLRRVP